MPAAFFVFALFLHNLFSAVWIGGMIVLALAVLPAVRQTLGPGPEARKLAHLIQRRLSVVVYVSMAGLAVTGLPLSRSAPGFAGFFHLGGSFSNLLTVKHLLIVAMVGIALIRSIPLGRMTASAVPAAGLRRAEPPAEKVKIALLGLNAVLGIAVLLLTALLESA